MHVPAVQNLWSKQAVIYIQCLFSPSCPACSHGKQNIYTSMNVPIQYLLHRATISNEVLYIYSQANLSVGNWTLIRHFSTRSVLKLWFGHFPCIYPISGGSDHIACITYDYSSGGWREFIRYCIHREWWLLGVSFLLEMDWCIHEYTHEYFSFTWCKGAHTLLSYMVQQTGEKSLYFWLSLPPAGLYTKRARIGYRVGVWSTRLGVWLKLYVYHSLLLLMNVKQTVSTLHYIDARLLVITRRNAATFASWSVHSNFPFNKLYQDLLHM